MHKSVRASLALAVLLAVVPAAAPAGAADVTFSGTLSGTCILSLNTPGVLGMTAGGALSSEAGVPALLAILSVGSNQLTINPPVWEETPALYAPGTELLEVAYSGLAGLGLANQAYTDSLTTRNIGTLPLSLLTMNARASNSTGFVDGDYELKVVVTCS
jgi:hypothetical protein